MNQPIGSTTNFTIGDTPTPPTPSGEGSLQSELAVFWGEMASHLPKSLERSALGDEKIFLAFRIIYPKIKSYLLSSRLTEIEGKIQKKRQEIWRFYHECQLWKEQKEAVKPYDDFLQIIKEAKER